MDLQEQYQPQTNPVKPRARWKWLVIVAVVIIFAAMIAGGVWYFMNQNATKLKEDSEKRAKLLEEQIAELKKQQEEKTKLTVAEKIESPVITKESEKTIQQFEKYQKERNANEVLRFFTPAVYPEDKEAYNFLTGADISGGSPRLYGTAVYSFNFIDYNVVSSKESGNSAEIVVKENRTVQSNAGATVGSSSTISKNKVFLLKKVDGKWMIEMYYNQSTNINTKESVKYDGFKS